MVVDHDRESQVIDRDHPVSASGGFFDFPQVAPGSNDLDVATAPALAPCPVDCRDPCLLSWYWYQLVPCIFFLFFLGTK